MNAFGTCKGGKQASDGAGGEKSGWSRAGASFGVDAKTSSSDLRPLFYQRHTPFADYLSRYRTPMTSSIPCMRSARALRATFNTSIAPDTTLPTFLVPALAHPPPTQRSHFSTTRPRPSKIGKSPLSLPPEVTFNIIESAPVRQGSGISRNEPSSRVEITGPLGKLHVDIPAYMSIDVNEGARTRRLSILDQTNKKQKAMWGTVRAYLHNHILGVSEGHTAILRLVGVGYRATIENTAMTKEPAYPGQKFVSLKVGYSHPIELGVPVGVKASCPQPTRILLEGIEKEVVKQFAAEIRAWRVPEPYKGKGIFVNDETIRLKAKKIK